MTGEELRQWRKTNCVNQQELANMLDVHIHTMSNWDNDRTPIPRMAELALEAIASTRAPLLRRLRVAQEELAHRRRMKAIAQGHRDNQPVTAQAPRGVGRPPLYPLP